MSCPNGTAYNWLFCITKYEKTIVLPFALIHKYVHRLLHQDPLQFLREYLKLLMNDLMKIHWISKKKLLEANSFSIPSRRWMYRYTKACDLFHGSMSLKRETEQSKLIQKFCVGVKA